MNQGQEGSSLDQFIPENLASMIRNYRVPMIVGAVGIVLIGLSVVLLTRKEAKPDVSFIEKSSTLSVKTKIKADIEGAVINPGVYEMIIGSRVDDLLIAAGGLASSADRVWIAKSLNRAAKLVDGGKLYIPKVADNITNSNAVLGSTDNINSKAKIDINSASIAELDSLPGVGQTTAVKIISGRPYQTIEELKTKKIVGNALFEKIKDLIGVY